MTLPGPVVEIIDAPPPAPSLTDTGTLFVAGLADKGATTGQVGALDVISSLGNFITKHGTRQAYNGTTYDSVEAFFTEGGSRLFFSRQVGPGAVAASAGVPTATPKFTASAESPGAWGNNLTVAVAAGVITVRESGTIVETSPVLADVVAAQDWGRDTSRYINVTPVGTGALTDSAAVTLTGGTDDRTNITDTQRQAAIDRFPKALGPGQIAMPGDTRTAAHTMLATHARDNNRFAYGDMPDAASDATITAAAASIRALGREVARHIQLLEPWMTVPNLSAPGTTKVIPPCGVQAGMAARNDAAAHPNRAVAGRNGMSRFATGVKYTRSDPERERLADAGVTVFLLKDRFVQAYDDVTPVDPVTEPEWLGAAGNRFVMRVVADALQIAEAHMFGSVGGSTDITAFNGDVVGMLTGWFTATPRALYGDTADEAFRVETGPNVNTPETLAARQLKAALALKIAPNARKVIVQITNQQLTEVL